MRKQDVIRCIEIWIEKYWNDPSKVALPEDPDFIFEGFYQAKVNHDSLIEENDSKWSFNGSVKVITTDKRNTIPVHKTFNFSGRATVKSYANHAAPIPGEEVVSELPEVSKLRIVNLKQKEE
ncbi:MAG: hypothetical protein K2M93_04785 [Muribaculaceae bacterium]|nr:hypothetical protein [Muribaculaceae bacterium]